MLSMTGVDSLDIVELVMALEESLTWKFLTKTLRNMTVQDIFF
jgi:acyl carrier protein